MPPVAIHDEWVSILLPVCRCVKSREKRVHAIRHLLLSPLANKHLSPAIRGAPPNVEKRPSLLMLPIETKGRGRNRRRPSSLVAGRSITCLQYQRTF